jgi:predicted heme/steroid binding protein
MTHPSAAPEPELLLTLAQLRRFSDPDERLLVAVAGILYDLTACRRWQSGLHEGQHFAGQDLTAELAAAPHAAAVLLRPPARRVGRLLPDPLSEVIA